MKQMIIDCHVHTCAFTPEHGRTSAHLLSTLPFRFMRWRLGLRGDDAQTELDLEETLIAAIAGTPQIDKVALLAFDAVYTNEGARDWANTHLYVKNEYAFHLARRFPSKLLFAASVHPYRRDAATELERCISAGAVLLKWLPIVQNFNPADPRCFPLYEMLAHHKVPLLCHTGGEKSLPNLDPSTADPMLLVPAIERGVTVIAAHCGTRSALGETDFFPEWSRLAREHEHFYGDTAALNLPTRDYVYRPLLENHDLRRKLIHGSDWPILPLPPIGQGLSSLAEDNWLKRDVIIKESLGFTDEAYWKRAATILRLPESSK